VALHNQTKDVYNKAYSLPFPLNGVFILHQRGFFFIWHWYLHGI